MMWRQISQQASSFVVIGSIGFATDGGVLIFLNSLFGLDLLSARLFSFSVAVTLTWYLNRQHTFSGKKDKQVFREWARYVVVNGLGALLNLAIFFWLIFRFNALANSPLVPLAIASAVALFFNFFSSKYIAFRGTHR
ncbi:MAG: GtrA family protein [Betaproteobacteria bacterium]|jgi:putative flippase GtrA